MKILKVSLKQMCVLLMVAAALVGCSEKKSSNNNNNNPVPVVTYVMTNGICTNSANGQQVDPSLCAGAAGAYTLNNGVCYQTGTGQQVPANYCQNVGTNNGYTLNNGVCYQTTTMQPVAPALCTANTGGQACYGTYYDGSQWGQCNGANCRGYTLQDAQGRRVTCQ
ncbi:MAG: hypothetical protein H7061_04195 [Bdellovibrionaceae bacterium]|nr:hypothetical protein [Bdellovibrio sp.]